VAHARRRYDQAALSVIVYSLQLSGALNVTPHTELLAAEPGQLRPCEAASEMVVWTSRGGERCYARHALGCGGGGIQGVS
jgi:hypothetical protein